MVRLKLRPHFMRRCTVDDLRPVMCIKSGENSHNCLLIFLLPHCFVSRRTKSSFLESAIDDGKKITGLKDETQMHLPQVKIAAIVPIDGARLPDI